MHTIILHFTNHQHLSEVLRNKRQSIVPATKILKLRAIRGNEKSPWRGSH